MKLKLTAALCGILLYQPFLCTSAFDLIDAWQAARDYDATYSAAKHQRDAGEEKAAQGLAQILPQVSVVADYGNQRPIEPRTSNGYDTHGWGVRASQPLFDISKYAAFRQGRISAEMARTQFSVTEQELIVKTSSAYFDVLLAYDTLEATLAAKHAYAKQLEQAKVSFRIGTATIVDTYEAQANYDAAIAKEIAAETELNIKANELRKQTGLDPKQIQLIDGNKVLDFAASGPLDTWQQVALDNSLEVKNRQQSLDMAEQELLARRGDRYPKVNLTANYGDNINTAYNSTPTWLDSNQRHTRNSSIGVELSIPLFAGGGISSQIREAAAKELQAKDELEAAKRQVKEDVRRTYLGVTSGEAEVKALEQLLTSMKSKLDSTRLGKEVGVRSNLDLLQAEQQYYETIRTLAEARYRYLLARLKLAQAAGVLEPTVLADVNRVIRNGAQPKLKTGAVRQKMKKP